MMDFTTADGLMLCGLQPALTAVILLVHSDSLTISRTVPPSHALVTMTRGEENAANVTVVQYFFLDKFALRVSVFLLT